MSTGTQAVQHLEIIQSQFGKDTMLGQRAQLLKLSFVGAVGGAESSGEMLRELTRFAENSYC